MDKAIRKRTGIFVSYRPFVEEKKSGGVQICTREYVDLIARAGFDLKFRLFDGDRRLSTRFGRRMYSCPYFRPAEPDLAPSLAAILAETPECVVFLNQTTLAALAPGLKAVSPKCRIVVLSHGLESTDLLHSIRLRDRLPIAVKARPLASVVLGGALRKESRFRSSVDLVCALSPSDADLERWLGTRNVLWLPRGIRPAPLDWRPTPGRFGFVGTLDHAPNLDGLIQALDALKAADCHGVRVSVVGGPAHLGAWLARKYASVDYLGTLDDARLESEAATWTAFIHPMFCLARGCSTKLATALAWQIPVVTTVLGHRGYRWREGGLIIGDSPGEFARACVGLLDEARATRARRDVVKVSETSARPEDNATKFSESIESLYQLDG